MEVETKHASLDTLAVTIQALHVNGKQMTLAVFRQLPVISPYNEDGSLAPMEYWGIVRYQIKDQGSMWAVCATGGRLFRGNIDIDYDVKVGYARRRIGIARQNLNWWHAKMKVALARKAGEYSMALEYSKDTPMQPHGYPGPWREEQFDDLEKTLADSLDYLKFCERLKDTMQAIEKLPQLFIAV